MVPEDARDVALRGRCESIEAAWRCLLGLAGTYWTLQGASSLPWCGLPATARYCPLLPATGRYCPLLGAPESGDRSCRATAQEGTGRAITTGTYHGQGPVYRMQSAVTLRAPRAGRQWMVGGGQVMPWVAQARPCGQRAG